MSGRALSCAPGLRRPARAFWKSAGDAVRGQSVAGGVVEVEVFQRIRDLLEPFFAAILVCKHGCPFRRVSGADLRLLLGCWSGPSGRTRPGQRPTAGPRATKRRVVGYG